MASMTHALEHRTQFICENQTKSYVWYEEGVSQQKIVVCAKNTTKNWTLFNFMKGGA